METSNKWYAVYTRSKWEKKVVQLLSKKKIETYCPLNKVVRQWSDRKKLVEEPLFKSYVFVQMHEKDHVAVKQTEGVINLVHWLGKPAVIRAEEITAIKDFLREHENVSLEKVGLNVNDRVRVINGPLMENEGYVTQVKSKTIKVVLSSLGYALVAELNKTNVEVLKPASMPLIKKPFYNYHAAIR